jgi:hypothetical protein
MERRDEREGEAGEIQRKREGEGGRENDGGARGLFYIFITRRLSSGGSQPLLSRGKGHSDFVSY